MASAISHLTAEKAGLGCGQKWSRVVKSSETASASTQHQESSTGEGGVGGCFVAITQLALTKKDG